MWRDYDYREQLYVVVGLGLVCPVSTVQSVPLSGHNIVISDDSLETTEHLQPGLWSDKKHPELLHEARQDPTGKTIRRLRQRKLWDCMEI